MRIIACLVLVCTLSLADEAVKQDESPWASTAEASLLLTSGNTQFTTLGGAAETNYKAAPWGARGKISYLENSQGGVSKAELFTLDGRADHTLSGKLSAYAQGGFLRNVFAGFNSRTSGDFGVNYTCIKSNEHSLTAELGVGIVGENRTDIGSNSFAMAKGTAEYKWKLSKTADFSTLLTAMENLASTNDFRLSSISALSMAFTSVLSAKLSYRVDFLNSPVVGKKNADTATTVSIVAKF